MKEKEKYLQHQDGRLYFRSKDHRDVIFEERYHNAMFYKDTEGKIETFWLRHPEFAILSTVSVNGGAYHDGLLEVNRRVNHDSEMSIGGARTREIAVLHAHGPDEAKVVYRHDSYSGYDVRNRFTLDGQKWMDADANVDIQVDRYVKSFRDDCLIESDIGSAGNRDIFNFTVYEFKYEKVTTQYKDFKGAEYLYVQPRSLIVPNPFPRAGDRYYDRWQYMCTTDDGCIYCTQDATSAPIPFLYFFKFSCINDRYSFDLICEYPNTRHTIETAYSIQMHNGNYLYCLSADRIGDVNYLDLYYSSNNGATWEIVSVWTDKIRTSGECWRYNSYTARADMCMRHGQIYIYFYEPGKEGYHLFTTEHGEITELTLPQYVDVPIEQMTAGRYANPFPPDEYVRLIIDPALESEMYEIPQVNFSSLFGSTNGGSGSRGVYWKQQQFQNGFNNVMFHDGEVVMEQDLVERWISFNIGNYLFYFDNMQLNVTDRCYAIALGNSADDWAFECLLEGDYCVPDLGYDPFAPVGPDDTIQPWRLRANYVYGSYVYYGNKEWKCILANSGRVPQTGSVYWQEDHYIPGPQDVHNWRYTATYVVGNKVWHNNTTWVCLLQNYNKEPVIGSIYWGLEGDDPTPDPITNWRSTRIYYPDDEAIHDNALWKCIVKNYNKEPKRDDFETTLFWRLVIDYNIVN